MREVLKALIQHTADGQSAAFCQLIATKGSTPQKSGAVMVVLPSGELIGTLGGGCVEAEVKRRALELLDSERSLLIDFLLDQDYGWDDGLICGGSMEIVVDTIHPGDDLTYFKELCKICEDNLGGTQVVAAVEDACESERPYGSLLLDHQGNEIARLGDSATCDRIFTASKEFLRPLSDRPDSYRAEGGIHFLPILPKCELLIVGAGHIGQAVAKLANSVDFDVTIFDDRPDLVTPELFPSAFRRFSGEYRDVLPNLPVREDGYALIVTRGHQHDEEALLHLIQRPFKYLGMIGSKRKVRLIFEDLIEKGIPQSRLQQVFAPVGLDIGARAVNEIAISIVSQLVAHRRGLTEVTHAPSMAASAIPLS